MFQIASFRPSANRRPTLRAVLLVAAMLAPGMVSDPAQAEIQKAPGPVITSFQASEGQYHLWTFSGTVTDNDPNPNPIVVTLGGLPSIQGKTTTVDSTTGVFSITIQLQPGEDGMATAQATDALGVVSNVAMTMVQGN